MVRYQSIKPLWRLLRATCALVQPARRTWRRCAGIILRLYVALENSRDNPMPTWHLMECCFDPISLPPHNWAH